ncbi:Bug family tripartite tricarboxylate transporter substrate binding protein [Roseomonas sp. BN140053]|uniref:Bug family tripartite tricarboxylate transporter substrate binding protein n=1 Tax=Roseomonas sp. BN140053 TaxID=3391898 RepID=UPI0039EB7E1F
MPLICAASLLPCSAIAQAFPRSRAIRLVVSGPVASATDLVSRVLADALEPVLGQRVVVENKPTANGAVAGADVARSSADGYSLLGMVTSSMVINPHINRNVSWHPVNDFTAIGEIGTTASVVAAPANSPYHNFDEALTAARARPDQVTFGVLTLTLSHFIALALKQRTGAEFSLIPFTTQAQMVSAALSRDIDLVSTGAGGVLPLIETGELLPLVVTSDERITPLPAVPTLAEFVPGFSAPNWLGLFGPAGMDPGIVATLNAAMNDVLARPSVREQLIRAGTMPSSGSARAMADRVRSDFERYRDIVAAAGLAQ